MLPYLNALGGQFVWDDLLLVVENPAVQSWAGLATLPFRSLYPGGEAPSYYRPLTAATFLLDHQLWGLRPFAFHATNVALHALAAVLVHRVARRLVEPRVALVAALLWAVHPLHTEAVAHVSGRADPLAACAVLGALELFLAGHAALAAAVVAVGGFARESALVTPLLAVVCDVAAVARAGERWHAARLLRVVPLVLGVGAYAGVRASVVGLGPDPALHPPSLAVRLLTTAKAWALYPGLFAVPVYLHMERRLDVSRTPFDPWVLAALAVLAGLVALAVLVRRRAAPVTLGIAWFLTALLPVSNVVPLPTMIAEHWCYVPSVGLCLVAGAALVRVARLGPDGRVAVAILLVAYAGLTVRRNLDWRDEVTLYTATLPFAPWSGRVHLNLGAALARRGDHAGAIRAYEEGIRLGRQGAPGTPPGLAYSNLGNSYRALGRHDDALAAFREALRLEPGYGPAHSNLGVTLLELGRPEDARRALETAVRLAPADANAHMNLGNALLALGDPAGAEAAFRTAIRLAPSDPRPRVNLATVLRRRGALDEADAALADAERLGLPAAAAERAARK